MEAFQWVPDGRVLDCFVSVISITTGTIVLMWLGEIITERESETEYSLIIMAGIIVRGPQAVAQTIKKIGDTGEPIIGIILIGLFIMVKAASILLTLAQGKFPCNTARKWWEYDNTAVYPVHSLESKRCWCYSYYFCVIDPYVPITDNSDGRGKQVANP
jgi:preprotein translocase subunit SecY